MMHRQSRQTRFRARLPLRSANRTRWISTKFCSGRRLRNTERQDRTMPHVIIKLQSGRSEQQKARIAEEVTKAITSGADCTEAAVSVCTEDINADDWVEKVYKPDIIQKRDTLYKNPG